MNFSTTKGDIIWGYLAQFFSLATGLITLPLILKMLTTEEVGLNYIFISISTLVTLFDIGFSSQFARNITYVLSGAQELQKEGVSTNYSENINERLLAITLYSAKQIYKYISIVALFFLLTIGTWYVYRITDGFESIVNLPIIWSVFCLSNFFNLYYYYFNSFLQGRGLIKESKQALVISKIVQITITFIMLYLGMGLLSVSISALLAPFVFRFIAYKSFYSNYFLQIKKKYTITKEEFLNTTSILFFNAKKIGVIGIFASAINYATTLILGAFFSLQDIASYGLMVQLVGIIGSVSISFMYSLLPEISNLLVRNNIDFMKRKFGLSYLLFVFIQFIGVLTLLVTPMLINHFNIETKLPSYTILIIYSIYKFAEYNQSIFLNLLLAGNELIYFRSSVCTGIFTFFGICCILYFGGTIFSIVLVQIIVLFAYVAWYWPYYTCKKYQIHPCKDLFVYPANSIINKIKDYV